MKVHDQLRRLAKTWLNRHKMDPDNFDITFHQFTDNFGTYEFVFVYNKAFAGIFMHDKTSISEKVLKSDFAFKTSEFSAAVLIEIDRYGKLAGRHSWTEQIISDLETELDPDKNRYSFDPGF